MTFILTAFIIILLFVFVWGMYFALHSIFSNGVSVLSVGIMVLSVCSIILCLRFSVTLFLYLHIKDFAIAIYYYVWYTFCII